MRFLWRHNIYKTTIVKEASLYIWIIACLLFSNLFDLSHIFLIENDWKEESFCKDCCCYQSYLENHEEKLHTNEESHWKIFSKKMTEKDLGKQINQIEMWESERSDKSEKWEKTQQENDEETVSSRKCLFEWNIYRFGNRPLREIKEVCEVSLSEQTG